MTDAEKTKRQLIKELDELRLELARRDAPASAGDDKPSPGEDPFYREIVESSVTGIYVYDAELGNNVYINPQYTRLTGYTLDDLNSLDSEEFFELFHPDDQPAVAKHIGEVAEAKDRQVVQIEYRFKKADGKWTWLLSGDSIFSRKEDGSMKQFMGTFISINGRKRDESRILEQMNNLTALREIDLAIIGTIDLGITSSVILDHVQSELNVDAASILLFNSQTKELDYLAGRGFRTEGIKSTNLRIGEGYAGSALLKREPVYVAELSDSDDEFARFELLEAEGFQAYYGAPLIVKGNVIGLLEVFNRSPLNPDQKWKSFMEALRGQTAIAIENAILFDDLQRANLDLELTYDSTLEGWVRALDLRDHETEGHTKRVTDLSLQLMRRLGVTDNELSHARRGALLHDIGKMGVSDTVLLKPGKLTDDEWQVMRQHPLNAYQWLYPINYLRPALDIPYCHHEKWDGTGYPRGLKGEDIPLTARAFAVVDVWDALNSNRPYRKAWKKEKVVAYIKEQSGKHFDPRVLEEFLTMMKLDA